MLTNLLLLSNSTASEGVIKSVISPLISTFSILGGLICTATLIIAGIHYISSSGHPEKLEKAKKIIRDALIGIVIVLSAAAFTSFLSHSYGHNQQTSTQKLPTLVNVKPKQPSLGLVGVLIKAITGVLQNIIESIGKPFIDALSFFTKGTPLMAENRSVFNLWLVIVGMADVLFILIVGLIGFNVMSSTAFGLDDLDIKQLLPQIILAFVVINSSIFIIDIIISLSNGMIDALKAGFGESSVWEILSKISSQTSAAGLATMLIMVVFLVLAFMLLVYYVGRIVTLYLGAVLSPLVFLLWLVPSFKDFAASAAKTYVSTIFVLFIHIVILTLAASLFSLILVQNPDESSNQIMSLIVGLSTLIALIKTQGVLSQLNYASIGPKSIRRLSSQFVNSFSGFGYREA